MSDQLSEFVEVVHASLSGTQTLDIFRDVESSINWIEVLNLLLVLPVPPLLLHERVMNKVIIKELIEDIELFDQEFVEGIDDGSHDTDAMGLDGVQHLVQADRLDLLRLRRGLHKHLGVNVIVVF